MLKTLCSDVQKRDYELEQLLYSQLPKMKPARENPLANADDEGTGNKGFQIDAQKFEPKIVLEEEEEEDEGGIAEKAKQVSLSKVVT